MCVCVCCVYIITAYFFCPSFFFLLFYRTIKNISYAHARERSYPHIIILFSVHACVALFSIDLGAAEGK